jgi:hypothetical protein
MKRSIFLLVFSFLVFGFAQAQDIKTDTATVVVHKDPRLDVLVKRQAAVNAAYKKATTRSGKGYRLLVVNTNNRDEAIAAKTKIYTYFPELKAYLIYQTPYFKLKAGNFKTREEAEKYRRNFNAIFPKGVFIINDTIEIKPEKEQNETVKIR